MACANALEDSLLTGKPLREARLLAQKLTRLAPREARSWMLKAIVDALANSLRPAEQAILKSIRLKKNTDAFGLAGWIYLRKKNFRIAEKYLRQSLRLNKENPLVLNLLGVSKERTGFRKEAAAWFTRALKILPDYPDALFNRSFVQERQRTNPTRPKNTR